jgi:NTP-dependent ternary system trypsin peptidase co-occuring protein
MHKTFSRLILTKVPAVLLLSIFLGLLASHGQAQQTIDNEGILIDRLLKEIQVGLAKVQKDLVAKNLPPLQSVSLDLTVEAKRQVGAKINLYIVSFGKKWERDRTQEVEITLKPPSPSKPLKAAAGPVIADELASAIESVAEGIKNAKTNTEVPLEPSALKVVLSFVVQGDTSGGVKFTITPVTVDLSGDLANSAIQKITVTYQTATKTEKPQQ